MVSDLPWTVAVAVLMMAEELPLPDVVGVLAGGAVAACSWARTISSAASSGCGAAGVSTCRDEHGHQEANGDEERAFNKHAKFSLCAKRL